MNSKFFKLLFLFSLILLSGNKSFSQLSGSYSIGSGGDYVSVNSAVSDLEILGVSGPVIFNILNGTYDEQIDIDSIPGASSLNTVTFQSQSGNPADVILTCTLTNPDDLFLIRLNGADNIVFKNLTITNLIFAVTEVNVILMKGYCDNVRLEGNVMNTAPFYNDNLIKRDTAVTKNLSITGNTFNCINPNGRIIFLKSGIEKSINTHISNNTAGGEFGTFVAMFENYDDSINITGNYASSSLGSFIIHVYSGRSKLNISRNKFYSSFFGYIIFIANDSSEILLKNNFLGGTYSAVVIQNSSDVKLFNNSLSCVFGFETSGCLEVYNSTDIVSMNNIFYCLNDFSTYSNAYIFSNSDVSSDYNDLFVNTGSTIATYNSTVCDMPSLISLTGNETHSVSKPVFFISGEDMHLTGASIGDIDLSGIPLEEVPADIDNDPRSQFSPYIGADEAVELLPVELISFTSEVHDQSVTLNWVTASEVNNYGFEIERKEENQSWIKTGFIKGNGTTSVPETYSFTDKHLASGKYNYRLKQIDMNGNFEYHNLANDVFIGLPEKFILTQNYPNPFNPVTKIEFQIPSDQFVTLKVFDLLGKEVAVLMNEELQAGTYEKEFNGSNLSSGVYFYRLEAGDFKKVKRMNLVK